MNEKEQGRYFSQSVSTKAALAMIEREDSEQREHDAKRSRVIAAARPLIEFMEEYIHEPVPCGLYVDLRDALRALDADKPLLDKGKIAAELEEWAAEYRALDAEPDATQMAAEMDAEYGFEVSAIDEEGRQWKRGASTDHCWVPYKGDAAEPGAPRGYKLCHWEYKFGEPPKWVMEDGEPDAPEWITVTHGVSCQVSYVETEYQQMVDNLTATTACHPFFMDVTSNPQPVHTAYDIDSGDQSLNRKEALEFLDEPERGEFEIQRLDSGYVVSILTFGDGWDTPPVRLACEDALGVADEVLRWLGFGVEYYDEVVDDEERYVLTDKGRGLHERPTWAEQERARIDALR